MKQSTISPRQTIGEVGMIRAIACMSVVLLHSIKFTTGESTEGAIQFGLWTLAGLLSFGTSTFVFISALVLAYSYPNHLPKQFYSKRIKFLLIPFACMAVFYAIMSGILNGWSIPKLVVFNLLGAYHGWFVLVIFQFYILHQLFNKYIDRFSAKWVLMISLVVNVGYLAFFNLVAPPSNNQYISYIWDRGYWMPFTGWVFYFALAYYCGKNYQTFMQYIEKYKVWIYAALPVSIALILYNNVYSSFGFGSKRMDMILFTVLLIFVLFLAFRHVKKMPPILSAISQYSFGIYLLHWFYLQMMDLAVESFHWSLGYLEIPLLFIGGIACSYLTINILNRMKIGKYIVGRVNVPKSATTLSNRKLATEIKS
ncbi:acyltransferase family protein [Paenibacillus nuruki]|uniref:acyltransferase family protein n=1 Tax=Paenibacillus nuruki TaxID=1886670 RepID=UPI0028058FD0|nr:acyltransferase family protein [Paenibacillus nuruki]CAJ1315332.1 Acyl-transf-3 domain-containing protein [Paenibacillus nuruki]